MAQARRWVTRTWVTHCCEHPVPHDLTTGEREELSTQQREMLEFEALTLCPACAPPSPVWIWHLQTPDRRRDLPAIEGPYHHERIDAARRRTQWLAWINELLCEHRKLLESLWRPRDQERARKRFRLALIGAREIERQTDAQWWLDLHRKRVMRDLQGVLESLATNPPPPSGSPETPPDGGAGDPTSTESASTSGSPRT